MTNRLLYTDADVRKGPIPDNTDFEEQAVLLARFMFMALPSQTLRIFCDMTLLDMETLKELATDG